MKKVLLLLIVMACNFPRGDLDTLCHPDGTCNGPNLVCEKIWDGTHRCVAKH